MCINWLQSRNTEPTRIGGPASVAAGRIVSRRGVTYHENQSIFFGYKNEQEGPAPRRDQRNIVFGNTLLLLMQ